MDVLPPAGAMKRPITGERNVNEIVKQNPEYLQYGTKFGNEFQGGMMKDDVVGRKIN